MGVSPSKPFERGIRSFMPVPISGAFLSQVVVNDFVKIGPKSRPTLLHWRIGSPSSKPLRKAATNSSPLAALQPAATNKTHARLTGKI